MKKQNIFLAIIVGVLSLQVCANACDRDMGKMQEKRIEKMTKNLKLTDDQVQKITALFKEQGDQMKKLHDDSETKLKAILTPDQAKIFDENQAKKDKKSCCKN